MPWIDRMNIILKFELNSLHLFNNITDSFQIHFCVYFLFKICTWFIFCIYMCAVCTLVLACRWEYLYAGSCGHPRLISDISIYYSLYSPLTWGLLSEHRPHHLGLSSSAVYLPILHAGIAVRSPHPPVHMGSGHLYWSAHGYTALIKLWVFIFF